MHRAAWKNTALALCTIAAITLSQPGAQASPKHGGAIHWFSSWTASPFDSTILPPTLFAPSVDAVADQTIRQTITLSRGGSQLRVRFTNEYGSKPLHIGAASISYTASGRTIRVPLTFGGANAITALAGAPVVADAVAMTVLDGANIEISLYLPDRTPIATMHLLGLQQSLLSGPGNFVMANALPAAASFDMVEKMSGRRFPARFFLSEVDMAGPKPMKTVVAFGDSITDGMGSTPDQNRRWPDYLARRIVQAKLNFSVVNQGIGGNQVLARGMGDSALARFDRDALALPGVSTVILMEGINDIGFSSNMVPGFSRPEIIPAEEIIQGYRQLIARAHARGVRIIGATMTAFGGSPAFKPEKEAVRQAVNRWIRTGGGFDAVVDFDAITKDPQKPDQLKPTFDGGDHIHLNDAGYEAMAAAINLPTL